MLTAYHWTEHRVPKDGGRKRTQAAEGVCSPMGGTTIQTNQVHRAPSNLTTNQRVHMVGLMALAAYVAEDGLVDHQWEERPLVL